MAMVTITKGGITTDVRKGELDWYKRNGWSVVGEPVEQPVVEVLPAEGAEEKPAPVKKPSRARPAEGE